MKNTVIIAGLALIVFAGVWKFLISPGLILRLPPGWRWEANFVGMQTVPDGKTGVFPEKDMTSLYIRSVRIADEKKRPASVSVEDIYTVINILDKKVVWEYILKADVDPATGRHLKQEWRDDIFVFPMFAERKTYNFRSNYVKGVPLAYEKEEDIEGISAYVFRYKGRGEYTESYEGTKDYPGVKVKQGQEIRCADNQLVIKIWVEPVTGEIVKLQESCMSGDYIYDIKTGKQLAAVLRWGGITAGDDVRNRAEKAQKGRMRILWITAYLPLTFLVVGIAGVGWGILRKQILL